MIFKCHDCESEFDEKYAVYYETPGNPKCPVCGGSVAGIRPADLPEAGASAERISSVMRRTAEREERVARKHHYLKTDTRYFQLQEKGEKTFEVRLNDRDFKKGDMVHLEEVVKGEYTGRTLPFKEIVYILHGGQFGIEEGYCVLQLK